MPITSTSGIAGTYGGGGGGGDGMERFAEMMLRMREMKNQEAAQKLETQFKIFDATGIIPSESDLKGPLKQLGVTLTPDMMQQFVQRGQQLRTSREEQAKTAVAQRRQTEAGAETAEFDVKKQRGRQEIGKRLAAATTTDEHTTILREGLDQGFITPSELTDEDKFQMALARVPEKDRPLYEEAHGRQIAGLMSPDQIAYNEQKRTDDLKRDADQLKIQQDQLDVARRHAKTAEDALKIDRQRAALEEKRFGLETDIAKAKMFSEKYSAIADYIKSNAQTSVEVMKALVDAKKTGIPIDKSLQEQALRGVARSMMTRGVMVDKDGNPIGVQEFQRLIESDDPQGLIHRLFNIKDQTFIFESLGKAGEDIEAAKGAKETKKPESKAKSVGRFVGEVVSGKMRQRLTGAAGEAVLEDLSAIGEGLGEAGTGFREEMGMSPTPVEDYMRGLIPVPRPVGR